MDIYLSSPGNQLAASIVKEMPVLLSYAGRSKWIEEYVPSFGKLLIDSGAFSVMSSGAVVDVYEYKDWSERTVNRAEAVAGLDDIVGNWRKSLRNYEKIPWSFPTFHDTDPDKLLDDLVAMARERGGWLGIGLKPPRHTKETWVRKTLDRIPDDIHVHGWALGQFKHLKRLDSIDSTAWFRYAFDLKAHPLCKHLTYAECLEIVVKSYRLGFQDPDSNPQDEQIDLFS